MSDQRADFEPDADSNTCPKAASNEALRDRVAGALYERERPPRDPHWANAYAADREVFEPMADAVLTALKPELDALAALRQVARGYCPHCGRGNASPTVEDWEQQKQRADQAEAALARVQALADECEESGHSSGHPLTTTHIRDALDPAAGPTATQATDAATTTRIFAALHRSAEQDVSRVIALYERWCAAGPPPLGTSMSRWWDARLVELHDAIRPPAHDAGPTVAEDHADPA